MQSPDEPHTPSQDDYKRDTREAAIFTFVSRSLYSAGKLEGSPVTALDAWDATPTGCFEHSMPEFSTPQHRKRVKARVFRQVNKATVVAEARERVLTVLKESSDVEDTESASKENRVARRDTMREATWLAWVEKVRAGQLTPQQCKHQLEKKFKIKVQVNHVELAVKQRKRGEEPTKLKDLRETRGRKPLLSEANEKWLTEYVRTLDAARVWFSWTLISQYAEHLWRDQEGQPAVGDDERSLSNRFTYKWYVKFLERHNLRITKLSTFDDTRQLCHKCHSRALSRALTCTYAETMWN